MERAGAQTSANPQLRGGRLVSPNFQARQLAVAQGWSGMGR